MNSLIKIGIIHVMYNFNKASLNYNLNENQRIALGIGISILQCNKIEKVNLMKILSSISCYSIEDDDINNAIVILKEIVELMNLLKINEIKKGV